MITHVLDKGKCHCTADLQFVCFGFSSIAALEKKFTFLIESIQVKLEVSQLYIDTSSYKVSNL